MDLRYNDNTRMDPLFLGLAVVALAVIFAYTIYLRRTRGADEHSSSETAATEWALFTDASALKSSGFDLWRVLHPEGTILTSGDFIYQNEKRERIATEMPSGLPRGSTLLIGEGRLIVTHVPKDLKKSEIVFKAGEGNVAKAKLLGLDRISFFLKAPRFEVSWQNRVVTLAGGEARENGKLIARYSNQEYKSLFAAGEEVPAEFRVMLMYLARGVYRG
jgi:hypothetical protein